MVTRKALDVVAEGSLVRRVPGQARVQVKHVPDKAVRVSHVLGKVVPRRRVDQVRRVHGHLAPIKPQVSMRHLIKAHLFSLNPAAHAGPVDQDRRVLREPEPGHVHPVRQAHEALPSLLDSLLKLQAVIVQGLREKRLASHALARGEMIGSQVERRRTNPSLVSLSLRAVGGNRFFLGLFEAKWLVGQDFFVHRVL